ncbi:hypothetical protein C2G38_2137396 [Gigaspora rosea]|uniref:BTB/POZ domain-containing protein n=1 Tax=Gigaspora rosea TaxID=44941 RepID=A0A397W0Q3_9GLOM|nr:hypothetical protein C2G38_2137396 [Gigaspora rosea]
MTEIFSENMSEDYIKLYETKEHYDTIITVGKEPNIERIYAHSLILCTRSSYFRRALSDEWAEKKEGYFTLSKPNISISTFKPILKFLYCGIVELRTQEDEIIELLIAVDELLIQKLNDIIQKFLIKNSCKFLKQSPTKMIHFIIHNKQFNELKEAYLETICKMPKLLYDSEEFLLLEEDALKLILECDNLDMKESVIWEKLILWGTAQHTIRNSEMMCEDTNNEDIGILNKTLQELIKLIRFYQIDRKEFIHVIWDHKHLLSEQLFKDLIHCLIDPDAKPLYNPFLIRWGNFKIDSELVNREIALILTNWINKKTTNNKASKGFQYNFNLLFRSSLDGLSSQTFHRKCDNKGATIVIAKAQKSDLLIGGYNPLDWNGENVYKSTTNSFIFVINLKDLKNLTVSRVNKNHSNSTIGCDNSHGPSFGEGPDLHVLDGCRIWKYQAKSYPKILNVDSFAISFYEVFQIVNNITK